MAINTDTVLVSHDEIEKMLDRMSEELNRDYNGQPLVVVGILTGAFIFTADLVRRLEMPVIVDFMQVSSYVGECSTGELKVKKDLSYDIKDMNVLIVEDIIDSGYSMKFLTEHLKMNGAKQIFVCALIDKAVAREVPVPIDFVGYTMKENQFVAGFGLDYNELERNIPFVYEVDENDLKRMDEVLKKDQEK